MKEPIIADSTCLIGLERIGYLTLLKKLYHPVMIPPEVQKEFGISIDWLHIDSPSNHLLADSLKLIIDSGEAEAIALACMKKCRIILDDKQARAIAAHLKLPVIGTVGILIKAKKSGIIPAIKPLLEELELNSFYISDSLREEALLLVNE